MIPHVLCALLIGCPSPPTGRDILQAMQDRYAGKWYRTLKFVQQNTATSPDGRVEHSVWREYAALPGRLRIEFEPADSGAGLLFVRDSQFVFRDGRLASATAFVHPLMVLGFDVYFDPVDRTVARLARLGFDLATVHEDQWDGRAVYVVGAAAGDVRTRQFWVDKERLVFVRLLEPGQRDTTRTSDIRFNRYRPVDGVWLSPEVAVLVDGQQRWLEQYTEIETGSPLPDALFDPRQWTRAQSPDTIVRVQGFLQRDDQFELWTIVVPLPLRVLGVRTFVVPLVGEPDRWNRYLNRYIEAEGRVSRLPSGGIPGIGFAVDRMTEVEPPGTARLTVDRGLTQHAEITLSVIPNRFAWRDERGEETGVNPLLVYTLVNRKTGVIRFMLPTNDLLCLTVRGADGVRIWDSTTQAPNPTARRLVVSRGGALRDAVQLPRGAAPRPGRYMARVGICTLGESDVTADFEVK